MRPLTACLFGAAVALAPLCAYASTPSLPTPDLRVALMMRFFGEVSSPNRALYELSERSENPLGEAALVVHLLPSQGATDLVARSQQGTDASGTASYAARKAAGSQSQIVRNVAILPAPMNLPVSARYTSAAVPLFTSDADAAAFSFNGPAALPASSAAFTSAPDESGLDVPFDRSVRLPVALRVGNLRVLAGFDAGLSSTLESGIDNTLPVYVPAFAGVSRSSLGANFAVPVAPRLLVGVGYNTERLVTGYGVPSILNGLDARNDTYTGNLTFLFPHFGSALSLSAQQYRYQDNVIPGEFTQLREDLDLTVKF